MKQKMSLSGVTPFLIVAVSVVIFQAWCGEVSYTRSALSINATGNDRLKLRNEYIDTTPWPALGQRRGQRPYYDNSPIKTPTWVRPQNQNIFMANENPTNVRWNGKIGNVHSGSSGGDDQGRSSSNLSLEDELREFSETLLRKDVNNAAKYVTINFQGKTTSRSTQDEAPLPLLSISQEAYKIPSIEKLMPLYNNYVLESNQNEHYTAQEKTEENNLLDTILGTSVMQHTRNFLIQKGKIGKDPKEFRDLLREIWFNMYARAGGRIGSSGFEHVFLAEIKNQQVSGLHNWLYFFEEERNNRANYLGFMKKLDFGNKGAAVKFHFTFQGLDKPVGSMFIGTSPELEIALYTTCFVLKPNEVCPLNMNGHRFIIRTYSYKYRGKNMIGSAFPEI